VASCRFSADSTVALDAATCTHFDASMSGTSARSVASS
jgi:hypothetical protein